MKLIAEDGTEYTPKTRKEAIELVKRLVPDGRCGPKPGHHVHRTDGGRYRFQVISHGEMTFGPSRATHEEAAEDYRRHAAGETVNRMHVGSAEFREACRVARARNYAAAVAASPDGAVRLAAPTCGFCGIQGHRANWCEKRRQAIAGRLMERIPMATEMAESRLGGE